MEVVSSNTGSGYVSNLVTEFRARKSTQTKFRLPSFWGPIWRGRTKETCFRELCHFIHLIFHFFAQCVGCPVLRFPYRPRPRTISDSQRQSVKNRWLAHREAHGRNLAGLVLSAFFPRSASDQVCLATTSGVGTHFSSFSADRLIDQTSVHFLR